jgi:hypothetical protein
VKFFLRLMLHAILKFYSVKINIGDLNKDLLVNLINGFVVSEQVYFLVFNLISLSLQDEIRIYRDKLALLGDKLNLSVLKVPMQLRFDPEFRKEIES